MKSTRLSLAQKLLILVILPVLISTSIAIAISSVRLRGEGEKALLDKSTAILSRLEAVRKFIANQGMLEETINMIKKDFPNGKLTAEAKEKIMNQVPIVASWKIGLDNAQAENYTFKIASKNARNPNNEANNKELQFLEKFKKTGEKTIIHKDKETDSYWVMRAVFLDQSHGCMICHGHPKTSPYNNEKDILGYPMENWQDGTLHGMFMIKSDLKPLQKKINRANASIIGWGAMVAALAILISVFVVRKIIRTTKDIIAVSEKVSEGDLTSRIEIKSNDELGDLSKYINKMVQALSFLIRKVQDSSEKLALSTKEISSSVGLISDGAQEQAAQFEELSSSVQSTADNANSANRITKNSVIQAEEARKNVGSTQEAMKKITNSSKEIADSLQVISEIASRTNILSLNASIEAARAGAHGKGFSVVAGEVRKLAEKSSEAAKSIEALIKHSINEVKNGEKTSNEAEASINAIVDDIKNIASTLETIDNATREQSSAMEQNTTVTTTNASSAEELSASAESLAQQADDLRQEALKFKL